MSKEEALGFYRGMEHIVTRLSELVNGPITPRELDTLLVKAVIDGAKKVNKLVEFEEQKFECNAPK